MNMEKPIEMSDLIKACNDMVELNNKSAECDKKIDGYFSELVKLFADNIIKTLVIVPEDHSDVFPMKTIRFKNGISNMQDYIDNKKDFKYGDAFIYNSEVFVYDGNNIKQMMESSIRNSMDIDRFVILIAPEFKHDDFMNSDIFKENVLDVLTERFGYRVSVINSILLSPSEDEMLLVPIYKNPMSYFTYKF